MTPIFHSLRRPRRALLLTWIVLTLPFGRAVAQDAPDTMSLGPIAAGHSKPKPSASEKPGAGDADVPPPPPAVSLPPAPMYDKTIFEGTLPADQLAFLKQFDGAQTRDLYRDKQFKALKKAALPGWMFHFGHDMPVSEAMDAALGESKEAVQLRDGRYAMLSGTSGLYPGLQGRGFVWVDMQEGTVFGGFYFRPTNGEPSPTLTVFSRQIKTEAISMAQLPPAFFEDYSRWAADERISPVTTRYFIGGLNERILLEHDEDFCASTVGPMGSDCLQMTADAADADMNTAYYLEQVHYATNATAWMIVGSDETAFLRVRDTRCGPVADPLGCRIRITREQIHRVGRTPVRPVHR